MKHNYGSTSGWEKLNTAYTSTPDRANEATKSLFKDYETMLSENAVYERYKLGRIFSAFLWLALSVLILVSWEKMQDFASFLTYRSSEQEQIFAFVMLFAAVLLVTKLYFIVKFFYCKRLERYSRKINRINNTILQRVKELSEQSYVDKVFDNYFAGNTDYASEQKNDLGEQIIAMRNEFGTINRKAAAANKAVRIISSALFYILGIVILLKQGEIIGHRSTESQFWIYCIGVYMYFVIDVVLVNMGEYFGKFMRPAGVLLACAYIFALYSVVGETYDRAAVSGEIITNDAVHGLLTYANLFYLLQGLSLLIGILCGDYLGMKTKWDKGFNLVMAYGSQKSKTKGSLIRRGTVSLIMITAVCVSARSGIPIYLLGLVWWLFTPLMKPFGSTIYAYFGRAKCISIELMFFSQLIFLYLNENGTLDLERLIYFGVAFVLYLILGGIVKAINDSTMFFEFMEKFI